jgi:hypothetical protein
MGIYIMAKNINNDQQALVARLKAGDEYSVRPRSMCSVVFTFKDGVESVLWFATLRFNHWWMSKEMQLDLIDCVKHEELYVL